MHVLPSRESSWHGLLEPYLKPISSVCHLTDGTVRPLRKQSRAVRNNRTAAAERIDDLLKAPNLEHAIAEEFSAGKSQQEVYEILYIIRAATRSIKRPLIAPFEELRICTFVSCLSFSEPMLRLPAK